MYRVTGGHAYNSVYPGPIGAILTPQLLGATDRKDPASTLPFASTLCGACYDVCPVKINIPDILVHLRHKYAEANRGGIPDKWDIGMKATSKIMRSGKAMEAAGKAVTTGRVAAGKDRKIGYLPLPVAKDWTRARDIPAPPAQSFRDWWHEEGCCGGKGSEGCCGGHEGGAR